MAKWNRYVKEWISKLKPDPYAGLTVEERFNAIYQSNDWQDQESVSGPGSNSSQTKEVIRIIESIIDSYSIHSIVDIPCGDFGWMKDVDLKGAQYLGGDIVKDLIDSNRKNYANRSDVAFEHLDLLTDPIPNADILIVRDCLVHLSNKEILRVLENIRQSNVSFILTTTFTEVTFNMDIRTGDWRPINLMKEPFSLPKPLAVFNEMCTENNGKYADKSLGLWPNRTSS